MAIPPIFSVLLPTHNRPDVIAHAIASVLAQSCGDFELLIVGDGASHQTEVAVASFADERIRWFNLPKAPGFGYANRNRVLKEARGRFIAHASDDDLLFPDHLAELKRLLDTGAALACTRSAWISSDGIAAPFMTNLNIPDEFELFLARHNSMPASCFAYRAESLPEMAAWPEHISREGDWHLWRRIIRENPAHPVACSKAYTVLHFSARRKNARDSGMGELKRYLEYADNSCWWPAILKPVIPPDSTEQAEWSRSLTEGGQVFADRFNQALEDVIDRLAWECIQVALPPNDRKLLTLPADLILSHSSTMAEMNRLMTVVNDRTRELIAVQDENVALKSSIRALKHSLSWRLTKPVRWLSNFLSKHGGDGS